MSQNTTSKYVINVINKYKLKLKNIMSNPEPDKWIVIKFKELEDFEDEDEKLPIYKLFASWYGGYTEGDKWKMNSGITKIKVRKNFILFYGTSGSCYKCHKKSYGTSFYTSGVASNIIEDENNKNKNGNASIMDENTNWLELDLI